jgi:hypothetical protein
MEIKGTEHTYRVGDKVGSNPNYTLYKVVQLGTGRECMLQIAVDAARNGVLDRYAYVLRELKKHADQYEKDFEPHRTRPDERLNYHFVFPELVESFRAPEQGNRRVNMLAFACAEQVSEMVPLSNIVRKDEKRVDIQSSVWILGKFLKAVDFAHSVGIEVGRLSMGNLLIQPDEHFVTIFDWSGAHTHPMGAVPKETARAEIQAVARSVIGLLGGDAASRYIPYEEHDVAVYDRYTDFLFKLAGGSWHNAHSAHHEFYELVDTLWERGFHPFTTFPLNEKR